MLLEFVRTGMELLRRARQFFWSNYKSLMIHQEEKASHTGDSVLWVSIFPSLYII